ncbi:hypothetical protein LX32DRAFT_401772 [Colletotrichum zoysiae]|uniref:Uncharacterized protein n=1 Tax=Colletotrichum zoysiae TaxID=1216348 RepID=A0AAD9HGJ7_9PEZI|nr:hypothetical protein LX32DRAFT_401772 [Colletotrichum zoysiae]
MSRLRIPTFHQFTPDNNAWNTAPSKQFSYIQSNELCYYVLLFCMRIFFCSLWIGVASLKSLPNSSQTAEPLEKKCRNAFLVLVVNISAVSILVLDDSCDSSIFQNTVLITKSHCVVTSPGLPLNAWLA